MTVLKGELAVKQSKILMRLFKKMKDYLIETDSLLTQKDYLNLFKLINNHYLILNGERIEGDIAYQEIYALANQSTYIIDDYIDIKTLQLLKIAKENIEIIIFSDNRARNNINRNFINVLGDNI